MKVRLPTLVLTDFRNALYRIDRLNFFHENDALPATIIDAMTFEDDGTVLHYVVINPGAPESTVFLHGMGGTPWYHAWLWKLAKVLDITIYALVLPCHGDSHDVTTWSDMAAAVLRWADALGLQNVGWAGHSVGGIVARLCKYTRPTAASGILCLAAPTHVPGRPLFFKLELTAVAIDVLVSTPLALIASIFTGDFRRFSRAVRLTAGQSYRRGLLVDMLRNAGEIEAAMAGNVENCEFLYGALDLAVPSTDPALGRITRVFGPHSYPILPWHFDDIVDAYCRLLGRPLLTAAAMSDAVGATPFNSFPATA